MLHSIGSVHGAEIVQALRYFRRMVGQPLIIVPRGQQVRLRTRYKRYIGAFMLHCRIMSHEDEGMMELLEIVPPSPKSCLLYTSPSPRD